MWNIIIMLFDEAGMKMEYMSAKEASQKWNISQRRAARLCSENRVVDAERVGNMWLIPKNSEKPIDGRSLRYKK